MQVHHRQDNDLVGVLPIEDTVRETGDILAADSGAYHRPGSGVTLHAVNRYLNSEFESRAQA